MTIPQGINANGEAFHAIQLEKISRRPTEANFLCTVECFWRNDRQLQSTVNLKFEKYSMLLAVFPSRKIFELTSDESITILVTLTHKALFAEMTHNQGLGDVDMMINVNDGESPVHSEVLQIKMPMIFERGIQNTSVTINTSQETMHSLLKYCYLETIDISSFNHCVNLLKLSMRLGITDVSHECLNYLQANRTEDNVFTPCSLSAELKLPILINLAVTLIKQTEPYLFYTNEWKILISLHPAEMDTLRTMADTEQ